MKAALIASEADARLAIFRAACAAASALPAFAAPDRG
jgi:hypothetical protein